MSKFWYLFLFMAVLLVASPVYAQGGAAPTTSWAVPIGAGLGIGIAAGLAGIGQGRVAAAVAESLARNPGARAGIQLVLFFGLALIVCLVLFAWVSVLMRSLLVSDR